MSQTTILKCDRCGESWNENDRDANGAARDLWRLAVRSGSRELLTRFGHPMYDAITVEWCRPCVEKFQVLWPRDTKTPTDPPAPTPSERLEALLREIAREEATQAISEAQR